MTLSDTCRRALLLLSTVLLIYVGASAQGGRRIREHEVQREETVYSIARRYGVAIDKVYELNPWPASRSRSATSSHPFYSRYTCHHLRSFGLLTGSEEASRRDGRDALWHQP